MKSSFSKITAASALTATLLTPDEIRACACGCGVFDVGTSSMLPQGPGGMVFTEFDYQNQYMNWSGSSRAPAANNADKQIRTLFITTGLQYFFNSSWGMQVEVPYDFRSFKTESADPNAAPGAIAAPSWSSIGDIRVKGFYTGFSPDLSTGLSLGLKLPTGSYTHNDAFGDVDRDTELGTGSTDLLLGGFHRQHLTKDGSFSWFAQAEVDVPMLIRDDYRPGIEADEAAGVYYSGWSIGRLSITPVAQVIASERGRDSGQNAANPVASGYERILLSPGLEFHLHPISVYADAELPVFQHVTGNQLVAPALFKLIVSYHF
jgi:hypothetical protein